MRIYYSLWTPGLLDNLIPSHREQKQSAGYSGPPCSATKWTAYGQQIALRSRLNRHPFQIQMAYFRRFALEFTLHTGGVAGSNPAAPTIFSRT